MVADPQSRRQREKAPPVSHINEPTRGIKDIDLRLFWYRDRDEAVDVTIAPDDFTNATVFDISKRMRLQVIGTLEGVGDRKEDPSEHFSAQITFSFWEPDKRQWKLQWSSWWNHQNTRPHQLSPILFEASHDQWQHFGERLWRVDVTLEADHTRRTFERSAIFKTANLRAT